MLFKSTNVDFMLEKITMVGKTVSILDILGQRGLLHFLTHLKDLISKIISAESLNFAMGKMLIHVWIRYYNA